MVSEEKLISFSIILDKVVEMHELWTEKARGQQFTIKTKIRLGTQEQLLGSPREDDIVNGRASAVVEVLAKTNCILLGRK